MQYLKEVNLEKKIENQELKNYLNPGQLTTVFKRDNTFHESTSQISSINLSLLEKQASNAVSQSYVEAENDGDNENSSRSFKFDRNTRRLMNQYKDTNESLINVKEAITDLYLAIKIRSCEELDRINE